MAITQKSFFEMLRDRKSHKKYGYLALNDLASQRARKRRKKKAQHAQKYNRR